MNNLQESVWVRELTADEAPGTEARSGDVLPDGSILLWRDDMNRMGLAELRSWILQRVVDDQATVALASTPQRRKPLVRRHDSQLHYVGSLQSAGVQI
jgi:hypothetical protein